MVRGAEGQRGVCLRVGRAYVRLAVGASAIHATNHVLLHDFKCDRSLLAVSPDHQLSLQICAETRRDRLPRNQQKSNGDLQQRRA